MMRSGDVGRIVSVLLCLATGWSCGEHKSMGPGNSTIEVWMLESPDRVRGFQWPKRADGTALDMCAVEHPANYVVHVPDDRDARMWGKTSTLQSDDGVVTYVSILPLNDLVPFPAAVSHATELARGMGIQDSVFFAKLSQLQRENPAPKAGLKYRARTSLGPRVVLDLEITGHYSERGWFLVFQFSRKPAPR